ARRARRWPAPRAPGDVAERHQGHAEVGQRLLLLVLEAAKLDLKLTGLGGLLRLLDHRAGDVGRLLFDLVQKAHRASPRSRLVRSTPALSCSDARVERPSYRARRVRPGFGDRDLLRDVRGS